MAERTSWSIRWHLHPPRQDRFDNRNAGYDGFFVRNNNPSDGENIVILSTVYCVPPAQSTKAVYMSSGRGPRGCVPPGMHDENVVHGPEFASKDGP
jgi:hypothetical protein